MLYDYSYKPVNISHIFKMWRRLFYITHQIVCHKRLSTYFVIFIYFNFLTIPWDCFVIFLNRNCLLLIEIPLLSPFKPYTIKIKKIIEKYFLILSTLILIESLELRRKDIQLKIYKLSCVYHEWVRARSG